MPSAPLQAAVYAALSSALSCPVYDHVPSNAAYPFVTIDNQMAVNAENLVEQRERVNIYLTAWSTYKGQKEVLDIMSSIKSALHHKKLALSSGSVVDMSVSRADTDRDVSDKTYFGRVTLSCIVSAL